MKNQKLNRKLAKWAGFTFYKKGSREKIGKLYGYSVVDEYEVIIYPDREWNYAEDLPDFATSLDACFKWLVPKLKMYELHSYNQDGEHIAAVSVLSDGGWRGNHSTDPAMALCLAIEKLIGELDES